MGAPVRLQKAVSRSKEKPQWGAERRAGTRYGPAIPSADGMGLAARQTNGRGVPRLRISALRYPLMGMRRVRNRQFGTTVRRDAPRGNAPARLNMCMEEERRTSMGPQQASGEAQGRAPAPAGARKTPAASPCQNLNWLAFRARGIGCGG